MNEKAFARLVEDALGHLYDFGHLQTHPLVPMLVEDQRTGIRGRQLQSLLLDTVQLLRPESTVPFSSSEWRSYRYLYLRYVQGMDPVQVARELGISLRQSQRAHQQAFQALSSILWDLFQRQKERLVTQFSPPGLDQEISRVVIPAVPRVAHVGETVDSVIRTVEPLIRKQQIRLDVSVPADLPPVKIPHGLLHLVLVNLVVVLTKAGTSPMQITAKAVDRGVEILLLLLATRQEGDLANLRGDETFVATERLLRTNNIVLETDGGLTSGISLSFHVPAAQRSAVLIVDDNPDAVTLFERYLANEPYQVFVAGSGEEALQRAREKQPTVITLDLMMSSQNGWEVLQTLKHDPQTYHIPVIVTSVLKQRDLALLLGATEFLVKPVSRSLFLESLRQCLDPALSERPGKPSDNTPSLPPRVPGRA